MGTVSGGGKYRAGATATITATPKEGYEFVKWNDGDTSASRTVTVNADKTYTATFKRRLSVRMPQTSIYLIYRLKLENMRL